jgi:hypothetical protein
MRILYARTCPLSGCGPHGRFLSFGAVCVLLILSGLAGRLGVILALDVPPDLVFGVFAHGGHEVGRVPDIASPQLLAELGELPVEPPCGRSLEGFYDTWNQVLGRAVDEHVYVVAVADIQFQDTDAVLGGGSAKNRFKKCRLVGCQYFLPILNTPDNMVLKRVHVPSAELCFHETIPFTCSFG